MGLFGNSKEKEVAKLVGTCIANASTAAGKPTPVNAAPIKTLGKKLASQWLESLPAQAIKECHPTVLAAFVLIGEARVYAKDASAREFTDIYVEAAQQVSRGVGLRAIAGNVSDSDFKLLLATSQMADASGLEFYREILDVAG